MANNIVQDALNHLTEDLRTTHGSNLSAVILYGSAAAGDHAASYGDYNVLVALKRITPEDLRLAQAPTREWQRMGHPVPVYFTADELRSAADVFPIEFHQMERSRVVLYGEDPFESMQISDLNLRHQTEYELRSKLIQLRRRYIPSSVSIEKLTALMSDSLESFATLFAPVLLLHGQQPPVNKQDCVAATVRLLRLDGEPFGKIFSLRSKAAPHLSEAEAHELFTFYMEQIERVIDAVDNLPIGS
ncbi:MAG: hypothetical protein WKF84_17825 [Pyrinomonadaceae bacterium]